MGRFIASGQRFGRWLALADANSRDTKDKVLCQCSCGSPPRLVSVNNLLSGKTQSCGCRVIEAGHRRLGESRPSTRTHGLSTHPLHDTWKGILNRCYNQTDKDYPHYGGRGITVCRRWRDPVTGLAAFVEDMGSRPEGRTVDRINNDGNYEPGNVRWATPREQRRNQRPYKGASKYNYVVRSHNTWVARTPVPIGTGKSLGSFMNEDDAGRAVKPYLEAAGIPWLRLSED